jgi:callose synthase
MDPMVLFLSCPCFSYMKKKTSLDQDSKVERHDIAKFALVWNEIISSFRSEDIISNRSSFF